MKKVIKNIVIRFGIVRELLLFLIKEKMWWLIPFILVLVIVGLLLVFSQSSIISPFLYTAF